jgi:hypothetical protein
MRRAILLIPIEAMLVACATSTPTITTERRTELTAAAQSCQREHSYVDEYEVDRFGRVTAWYRMGTTMRGELQPFFDCVHFRADSSSTAAKVGGTSGGPATPTRASSASPASAPSPRPAPRPISKQEREEGRAAVDRAKAEAYRRIEELDAHNAPSVPTAVPAVASPGVTSAVVTAHIPAQPLVEILTNESILAMSKGGLDESAILTKIATTSANFDTRPEALVALKQQGVSDRILEAMIGKR